MSRQLQQQLDEVQRTREDERKQLLQRLEEQRASLGADIKELRERNAAVSLSLTSHPLNKTPNCGQYTG